MATQSPEADGNNLLNAVLTCANIGIVAIDQSARVIVLNDSASRIIGLSPAEAIGRPVSEVIPPSGLPDVINTGQSEFNVKVEIGGRSIICNRTPIRLDGQIVGSVAVFQDVEDLETISRELDAVKQLNLENDAILDSSYDGIVVADGEGRLLRVNLAYERITGLNRAALIGRRMHELVATGVFDHSSTLAVLEQKRSVTIVQTVRTGRTMLVTGSPILDEVTGEVVRVVSNCRDLTDLNRLKQELEESQAESLRYKQEVATLRAGQLAAAEVVASSQAMRRVLDLSLRLAEIDSTVLLLGESGVGKDVIAQAIHKASPRAANAFVRVNCGAIPESLMESELFGYEEGAFTGASKGGKPGMFELADQGTLFLDEIGDLSLKLQVKLLTALQERVITRVGGTRRRQVEIRVIAATNQNLTEMISAGTFRQDLYYRLNVFNLQIPPLRERPEDVQALVIHLLKKLNQRYHCNKRLAADVVDLLLAYPWPGNVRELQNVMERLVVLSRSEMITREDLPEQLRHSTLAVLEPSGILIGNRLDRQQLEALYRQLGTTRAVARQLGCNQSTVARRMKRLGIPLR